MCVPRDEGCAIVREPVGLSGLGRHGAAAATRQADRDVVRVGAIGRRDGPECRAVRQFEPFTGLLDDDLVAARDDAHRGLGTRPDGRCGQVPGADEAGVALAVDTGRLPQRPDFTPRPVLGDDLDRFAEQELGVESAVEAETLIDSEGGRPGGGVRVGGEHLGVQVGQYDVGRAPQVRHRDGDLAEPIRRVGGPQP